MEKITNFMRVTKTRSAHDTKAASAVSKPVVVVDAPRKSLAPPATTATTVASPSKKRKAPVVTTEDGELYENGVHVPTFVFQSVKYARKDTATKLSASSQKLVDYIEHHYEIPDDFEMNYKYGPHSGLTYFARLLRAYKLKLLVSKTAPPPAPICITCTATGHVDRDCPDGF